jgi:ABC-type lipoprotein export system ATPase subunit
MIALNEVTKTYTLKKKTVVSAVRGVSLNVEPGEFVVITGRSGSGKTTLLNLIAGLARPTSGQVMIDNVDLWSLSDPEQSLLRNRKMGFVFQFPSLLPSLTTLENVVLPTMFGRGNGKRDACARAARLLDEVGLSDKLPAYPRHLSAGQQQRVVVARSLINQPQLLLADEPTSNLDEQTEREIIALFQEIHARGGITILLVTHAGQLVPHGTRAVQMADGAIVNDRSIATLHSGG